MPLSSHDLDLYESFDNVCDLARALHLAIVGYLSERLQDDADTRGLNHVSDMLCTKLDDFRTRLHGDDPECAAWRDDAEAA